MAQALKNQRLARYEPWFEDVRKEKPYQLEEKIEPLFHEKSQTAGRPGAACSARPWRRCASTSPARRSR